jgi:hypothetical protein
MTHGFKDAEGNFHPTGNDSNKLSSHQVQQTKQSSVNHGSAKQLLKQKTKPVEKKESPFHKETNIKPLAYHQNEENNHITITPKQYLDLTSSTGLEARGNRMHNSGIVSDLGGIHSDDPKLHSSMSRNYQAGGDAEHFAKHHYEWIDGEQYVMPKKYYIIKDKDDNYTDDFHKYIDDKALTESPHEGYYMEGLNEEDFIDENTMPKLKENTINPIMGTGEDNREDYVTDRTTRYTSDGKMSHDGRHTQMEIFRGDELGTVEYLKRNLRKGKTLELPMLDFGREKGIAVKQHEGRHRARAMFEEGIKEFPVNTWDAKQYNPKHIIGQESSLMKKHPNGVSSKPEDTRYPIMNS